MRRALFLSVMALLCATVAPQPLAAAEAGAATPMATVLAAIGASPQAAPMSPLLQPAGYRCRRDCRVCRSHCYARFRVHCHGHGCRQDFVLCMRHCWQDICRRC